MHTQVAWVDNHCHLPAGTDGDSVVEAASEAGVVHLVDVATDVESARKCIANSARHADVSATVGVHPHEASAGTSGVAELLSEPGVVAVGEAGLDYHYDHSPRDAQAQAFGDQIALAHEHDLPLVIHTREAWADTFALLDDKGWPRRTVFHCFTGGVAEADVCLERGALLSFSGIVTFPTASDVAAAAARCPLDRLLVETDSPYLAPVPHRGKRNQPAWVGEVGKKIATLHGVDAETVAGVTSDTAQEFYGF